MKFLNPRLPVVVIVFFGFGLTAAAHDTWLAPESYHSISARTVTLSLTSGMEFPKLEHAIKLDRVAAAKLRYPSGKTADVSAGVEGEHALALHATAPKGVTIFWTVLHPRPSELKSEQVREYVEHLGITDPEATIAAWELKRAASIAYRYFKYAKTFVRIGDGRGGRAWSEPAGMRLELVPQADPTRVMPGATLKFILLDEGMPRARYPVSVIHGGSTRKYVTNEEGRFAIDVAKAGAYLVRATTLVPTSAPDREWDVHFTTLSFESRAPRQ